MTEGQQRVAGSAAELPTPARMAAITAWTSCAAGRLPAAPISELANMRLAEVGEGHVAFEAEPRFAHYNPLGSVHDGWCSILLDSAMTSR